MTVAQCNSASEGPLALAPGREVCDRAKRFEHREGRALCLTQYEPKPAGGGPDDRASSGSRRRSCFLRFTTRYGVPGRRSPPADPVRPRERVLEACPARFRASKLDALLK